MKNLYIIEIPNKVRRRIWTFERLSDAVRFQRLVERRLNRALSWRIYKFDHREVL